MKMLVVRLNMLHMCWLQLCAVEIQKKLSCHCHLFWISVRFPREESYFCYSSQDWDGTGRKVNGSRKAVLIWIHAIFRFLYREWDGMGVIFLRLGREINCFLLCQGFGTGQGYFCGRVMGQERKSTPVWPSNMYQYNNVKIL